MFLSKSVEKLGDGWNMLKLSLTDGLNSQPPGLLQLLPEFPLSEIVETIPHQTASTHLGKDRCRRIGPGKNRKNPWHGFRMIQDAGAQDDAGWCRMMQDARWFRSSNLCIVDIILVYCGHFHRCFHQYPKTAGVIRTAGPNDLASPGAEDLHTALLADYENATLPHGSPVWLVRHGTCNTVQWHLQYT